MTEWEMHVVAEWEFTANHKQEMTEVPRNLCVAYFSNIFPSLNEAHKRTDLFPMTTGPIPNLTQALPTSIKVVFFPIVCHTQI